MIILIAFTIIVVVFSCALIWKSIKACRHRNSQRNAEREEEVQEVATPSAPLLTASQAGICVENGKCRILVYCWVGSFLVSLFQAGIWALARWRGDAHKQV